MTSRTRAIKRPYVWNPEQRFGSYSSGRSDSGCWIWSGPTKNTGYGWLKVRGAVKAAHRYSWEMYRGEIPSGMCVCHRCDVRLCVNPDHLFLGTQRDNYDDMVAKGRRASFIGAKNGRAKLTTDQVGMIRGDDRVYRQIAADYGVSTGLIGHIKKGRNWNV